MHSFFNWVSDETNNRRLQSELRLLEGFLETFYPIDPEAYDALFGVELRRLAARLTDPHVRKELEAIEDFAWTAYIAASVRNSGVSDPREVDERTHDIASKLLIGGLFTGYDPTRHGPFGKRFRAAVGNAVRNQVEKTRNRRRYLPSVSINQEQGISPDDIADRARSDNGAAVEEFRQLVAERLGELALAILELRLEGGETKSPSMASLRPTRSSKP
jgi:hypothetical protein